MEWLPTLWFVLIAVLWLGYLFLEGFDLGVGMLMGTMARNDRERRVMLNTIGPVWDGNEVWLLTAGGATFAAFPHWYASLFSGLYIPLVLVLAALIFRAVSIEYRGKAHTRLAVKLWDLAMSLGSFVAAFGVGALLALTTLGLPLNANGDRVGGAFAWFGWEAVLGGLAVVGYCLIQALAFLRLKTDGEIRQRSGRLLVRWLPLGLLPLVLWALVVLTRNDSTVAWVLFVLSAVLLVLSWGLAKAAREGLSFSALGVALALGLAAIFTAVFPVVLPSTLDPSFNLTIANASSSAYTLRLMSVVAAFGLPLVLAYQAWSYWVFRKRIHEKHIPELHPVTPVVK